MKRELMFILLTCISLTVFSPLYAQTEQPRQEQEPGEKVDKNKKRKARGTSHVAMEKERQKARSRPATVPGKGKGLENRPENPGRDDDDVSEGKPVEGKEMKKEKEGGTKSNPGGTKEGHAKKEKEKGKDDDDAGDEDDNDDKQAPKPKSDIKGQGKGPDHDKVKEAKEKGKN